MARKPRIQTAGLIRHVMSRGVGGMRIFFDDADHRHFRFLLSEVVDRYHVECWGYCDMSNHYHAILRPTLANISAAMRTLNGDYAQWWNRRHGRVGYVLQGRFKDQIVQSDRHLMTLIRYVARNPLRAGMVKDLAEWRHGSYRALGGIETAPPFLSMDLVLSAFGTADRSTLQSRFTSFVLGDAFDDSIEDRFRSRDKVVGDRDFKRIVLGIPDKEEKRPTPLTAGRRGSNTGEPDRMLSSAPG